MLVALSVTLCLCVLAIAGTAKVVRLVMGRFGIDSMSVLLWFGLAEWPSEERLPRAKQIGKTVGERSDQQRRPSPHRSLGRLAARRRPAVTRPLR
jgi:hypothetical protein